MVEGWGVGRALGVGGSLGGGVDVGGVMVDALETLEVGHHHVVVFFVFHFVMWCFVGVCWLWWCCWL